MKKIWLIAPTVLLLTPTILANVSCSNSNYKEKTQEMRAVWLTPLKDPDFYNFTTPEAFKTKIDSVMQVMNRLHLNTLIYHVRTHNDAMLSYTLPIKTTNIKVKALSYTNTIGE